MHDDSVTDLTLARDGQGRLYVPGTSLTGALRSWLVAQRLSDATVQAVWGFVSADRTDEGHASRMIVHDGAVTLPPGAAVERRDGVGIDRITGAAATGVKYDRAVLPTGSTVALSLAVETTPGDDTDVRLLKTLLQGLSSGEVRLGAAMTRGLGQVRLESGYTTQVVDLSSRDGLLRSLRSDGADNETWAEAEPLAYTPPPRLDVEIHWMPHGPLMVRADGDGLNVDAVPLVTHAADDQVTLALPGSSVKGVVRAHAERILRTVLDLPAPAPANPRRRFLDQLAQLPLVDWLFGGARRDDGESPAQGPLPGRGALAVDDCLARIRIGYEQWAAIAMGGPTGKDAQTEAASERHLRETLEDAGLGGWAGAHHVAIDRWTGGAADQRLYSVLEPHGVRWGPLRIRVDLSRIPDGLREATVALLVLVLRDLADGRLPLGFATRRGMGCVQADRITLTSAGDGIAVDGTLDALDDETLGRLRRGWQQYLDAQAEART